MRKLVQLFNSVLRDQRGATAIEYGLLAAMIALALVTALTSISGSVVGVWTDILLPAINGG